MSLTRFPDGRRGFDLLSKRFGRLVVRERSVAVTPKGIIWKCECDCGNMREVSGGKLRAGLIKSCGCLARDSRIKSGRANKTHGMKGTPEYRTWAGMKSRCLNPRDEHYPDYGGRGISICPEWIASFEAFFACVGPKPSAGHSIERIDVNGNYEPGNLKWATTEEQNNNRRDNRFVTAFGETMTVGRWSKRTGISMNRIYQRLNQGWSSEDALTVVPGTRTRWNQSA